VRQLDMSEDVACAQLLDDPACPLLIHAVDAKS
jgi:hypothetical protein